MVGQVWGERSPSVLPVHIATPALGCSHRKPSSNSITKDTASEELHSRSRQIFTTAPHYHLCRSTNGCAFRMCFQSLLKRIKGDSTFCQFFPPASTRLGCTDTVLWLLRSPIRSTGFIIADTASPNCKKQWHRLLRIAISWSLLHRATTKKFGDFTLKSLSAT